MSGTDPSAPGPRPVDAMIAGAQKAGTSSLKRYLGQHPAVATHDKLELSYFVRDREYERPWEEIYSRYFPAEPTAEAVLLGKSVGIMFLEKGLRRLYEHNPACRLIVSLRDPVDRAYSAFWYMRRKGWETESSFEAALEAEEERGADGGRTAVHCSYLARGRYAEQLERLTGTFGRDRWKAVLLEDLHERPERTCRELFEFLGVDPDFTPETGRRHNPSRAPRSELLARLAIRNNPVKRAVARLLPEGLKRRVRSAVEELNEREFDPPPMDPETRRTLIEHFRPHNERLEELIGRDLSAWNRLPGDGAPRG